MPKQATTTFESAIKSERLQAWTARIARFTSSQQTVAAFCRVEGISVPSFYHWRARLGQAAAKPTIVRPAHATPPFIDLGTYPPAQSPVLVPAAGLNIRLDLGGGLVLSIEKR